MLRYLNISDIHLGHNRTLTKFIVENLFNYFSGYSSKSIFAKIDLIFIVGDLFDQLIDAGSAPLYEALEFITSLLLFCERHNIKLRVLEGTPSHDRQQARLVETMLLHQKTKADVKWIKTLFIERIEDLNLSILYIPDEYTSSCDITQGLVRDLLREQNLEQVDIAMMHGVFGYQMRGVPGKHDTHDENFYLSIVKHFINIGHHHTHSNYERIIAQGSFDRLAHGEPEPKGGVLVTIRYDGSDYYEFIENKNAKIYKTITLDSMELDKTLKQIERELKKIPNESYIRIRATKLHPVFLAFAELKKQYPFLHFSKLSIEEELERTSSQEVTADLSYSVVEIRKDNVTDLIMGELTNIPDPDQKKLRGMLHSLAETL